MDNMKIVLTVYSPSMTDCLPSFIKISWFKEVPRLHIRPTVFRLINDACDTAFSTIAIHQFLENFGDSYKLKLF